MGIIAKKMDTTIMSYIGFRDYGLGCRDTVLMYLGALILQIVDLVSGSV